MRAAENEPSPPPTPPENNPDHREKSEARIGKGEKDGWVLKRGESLKLLVGAVVITLSGCGKEFSSDQQTQRQSGGQSAVATPAVQATIDLSDEIAKAIAEIKESKVKPLPKMPVHLLYPTQRDKYGVQFWIAGNHAREVIEILSSVYGAPKLIQTNKDGWINAAYTVAQTGAAVSFFTGKSEGKEYTHLIITQQPPRLF